MMTPPPPPPPPPPPIFFEDLMVEMLSRLPVKSLVRFRCVSKYFKFLISNPNFVKLHLRRSPKNADILVKMRDSLKHHFVLFRSVSSLIEDPSSTNSQDLSLDWGFNLKHKYDVVGSCNGLVCLVTKSCRLLYKEYHVRLWNPATRLRSQKSPCLLVHPQICSLDIGFGFGYDSLGDTYKVISIISNSKDVLFEVKVCNIGNNYWRNIQSFPGVLHFLYFDGVYLSGTLNWLVTLNFNFVILSLDLEKETYRQLLLPRDLDESKRQLGVLKDCLCLFLYKKTHFVVWQMKECEDENSWNRVLNISYQDLHIHCLQELCFPLCTFVNCDILMMGTCGRLRAILYNHRDIKVVHPEIPNNILWVYANDYVQSLVSPY